jgi:hypothetical protein
MNVNLTPQGRILFSRYRNDSEVFGDNGVYEDECGLNECIGLKSSNHSQMLHRLALRKLFACISVIRVR